VIAESLSPQASRELRLSALNTLTPGKFPAEEFALLLTTAAKSNAEYLMRGAEFLLAPSQ
jgi:hypothetical protein